MAGDFLILAHGCKGDDCSEQGILAIPTLHPEVTEKPFYVFYASDPKEMRTLPVPLRYEISE